MSKRTARLSWVGLLLPLVLTVVPSAMAQLRTVPDSDLLRYDERFQRQSHNSYAHEWATLFENGVFNAEIDLRNHNPLNGDQNWKVKHWPYDRIPDPLDEPTLCGNADNDTNATLIHCLRDIREWHNANPNHPVVTIVLDLKDDWQHDKARAPEDLDARLTAELGGDSFFTPSDFSQGYSSVREAAAARAWPAVGALRGKFIVIITPHANVHETRGIANKKASDYVLERSVPPIAFVCPRGEFDEIDKTVAGFTNVSSQSVVCFNHEKSQIQDEGGIAYGRALRDAGYLLRVWGIGEGEEQNFRNAIHQAMANFIAVDYPEKFEGFNNGRTEGGYGMGVLGALLPVIANTSSDN